MIPYIVRKVSARDAKSYIHTHHYSHGSHNGPSPCYGLFDVDEMIGCLMFATPCSENVRASVFGKEHKQRVVELHRLHIMDITPKNTESWFISRCLKRLQVDRPETKAVISFSDSTEGHSGIIYQATNFLFCGTTGKAQFFRDQSGRLRHPRQNGVNISITDAKEMGWSAERRGAKNRYIYVLDRQWKKRLLLIPQAYPDKALHSEKE